MDPNQENLKHNDKNNDDEQHQPSNEVKPSPTAEEDSLQLAPTEAIKLEETCQGDSDKSASQDCNAMDQNQENSKTSDKIDDESQNRPSVEAITSATAKEDGLQLAPTEKLEETCQSDSTKSRIQQDLVRSAPRLSSSTSNGSGTRFKRSVNGSSIARPRRSSGDPDEITTNSMDNEEESIPGAFHVYTNNEDVVPGVQAIRSRTESNPGEDENLDHRDQNIIAHLVVSTRDLVIAEKIGFNMNSSNICGVSRKFSIFALIFFIIVVVNLSLIGVISRSKSKFPSTTGPPELKIFTQPVLQTVKERGRLRCYAFHFEVMQGSGMSLDLCRAIAAAIFEDPEGVLDYIDFIDMPFGEHFAALWNGTIDISTNYAYYTMNRNVYEPSTGLPVSYSTPFFYSGNMFAGKPEFVDCADRLDTLFGVCRDLSICVSKGTAHVDIVDKLLPGIEKHEIIFTNEWYESFVNGTCNIYIVDQVGWTGHYYEPILRNEFGYEGEFVIGTKVHSSDQMTIISKGDDQEWAGFCNSILHGLITAEAFNITQEIALSPSLWSVYTISEKFPSASSIFGDGYKNIFQNAIAAVGNYGELYERHFESILPREDFPINSINSGDSGVLRSVSFGTLTVDDEKELSFNRRLPNTIPGGTLESIVERGVLRCGVIGNPTKYAFLRNELGNDKEEGNTTKQVNNAWAGIDIEYCLAIAAAIFPNQCLFAREYFNEDDDHPGIAIVDVGDVIQDGYIALNKDEIDVFAGGSISLLADLKEVTTGKGFTFTPPYYYYDDGDDDDFDNSKTIDNNNIHRSVGRSLVTQDTDWQWSTFVRWITIAIIYAEEQQITSDTAFKMPVVELFGSDFVQMFRDVIFAVGNYGDIFNRTISYPYNITRKGRNLINVDQGPQLVPIPLL